MRLLVLLLAGSSARAVAEGVQFDIPRQAADGALIAFAQQADVPILFPLDRVSRLTANSLVGEYPVEDGLKVLLEGTGLIATVDRTGQLTVQVGEPAREGSMNTKRSFLGSFIAAVMAGGAAGTASAQAPQSASAQAMLEEVVVTARRREESLQDLPLSVSALTADAMQAQGVYNLIQIQDFVPNISLTEDVRANDTLLYIRGLGGGFSNPSQVYGTAMYVDGHLQAGNLGAFNSTLDVERVEVLRGPQGTLFGKNTTGGAINIITAKPGPEFDSYLTLRAGDYGQRDIRGMINYPINENVFTRFNIGHEETDGWWYNRYLQRDTNGTEQRTLGAAVRYLAGDAWTLDARVAFSEDRDDERAATCQAYPSQELIDALEADGQDTSMLPGPFEDGMGAWGGSFNGIGNIEHLYRGATIDYMLSCEQSRTMGEWITAQDLNARSHVDNEAIYLDATYAPETALGPFENVNVQFKWARRYNEYKYLQDRDWTELKINGVGMVPFDRRGQNRSVNTFETIFNSSLSDRLDFTAGVFWMEDESKAGDRTCLSKWQAAFNPNDPGPDGLFGTQPGEDGELGTDDDVFDDGTINGMFDDDIFCELEGQDVFQRLPDTAFTGINANHDFVTQDSIAMYAHFDYALNERWDLAFGIRYSEDTRGLQNVEVEVVPGTCSFTQPGDPPPTEQCEPTVLLNRETVIDNGVYNNVEATYDDWTPMFSITRNLTPRGNLDDGMVYFLISRGWLTGAFNDELNSNRTPEFEPLKAFGDEHVTNYEIGFKGSLGGGRVRMATALFWMDYTDKQEEITLDNSDGRFGPDNSIELTQNVADVEIYGIELELRASPWDGGFVSLDAGYLKQKYSDFVAFNPDTFGFDDLSDTAISARTPEWTITASVEHAFMLGNGATLTPQLGVYAAGEYEWQEGLAVGQKSSLCHQDSYSKWRTRLTYAPADGNWSASLFGSNITDERILNLCGNGNSGAIRYTFEPPEWWGVEFTANFGAN